MRSPKALQASVPQPRLLPGTPHGWVQASREAWGLHSTPSRGRGGSPGRPGQRLRSGPRREASCLQLSAESLSPSGDDALPNGLDVTFEVTELRRLTGSYNTMVGNNEGSMVRGFPPPGAFRPECAVPTGPSHAFTLTITCQ